MNKLFVAYKPRDISSNDYLQTLKKKYGAKKAGYAGTLDPFARGTLIVAFGAFTKLFRFLDKEPKVYECTIWLGAYSLSLDDKNIQKIDTLKEFTLTEFEKDQSISPIDSLSPTTPLGLSPIIPPTITPSPTLSIEYLLNLIL